MPRLTGEERVLASGEVPSVLDIARILSPAVLLAGQSANTVAVAGSVTINANYGYISVNSGTIVAGGNNIVSCVNSKALTDAHNLLFPMTLSSASYNDATVDVATSIQNAGTITFTITNNGSATFNASSTPLPIMFEAH